MIISKKIGSINYKSSDKIKIINDSIYINEKIIFNYLPIRNLNYFILDIKKSLYQKKYWVLLLLDFNKLYLNIKEGKLITNRELIFEMIFKFINTEKISFNEKKDINIIKINEFKFIPCNFLYCIDKSFLKVNKIYFNFENKIITIDKCDTIRLRIPKVFLIKDYQTIYDSFRKMKFINNETVIIISKNDVNLLKHYNKDIMIKKIIYSEDINLKIRNYHIELGNLNFINQLKYENNNFFLNEKNIYILCKNLDTNVYHYLSYCYFENIFLIDDYHLDKNINIILKPYENYRLKKNNNLFLNYIFENSIYLFDQIKNYSSDKITLYNSPWNTWYNYTNQDLLLRFQNLNLINKYIEIEKKYNWDKRYTLRNSLLNKKFNCPITLSPIKYFITRTNCNHIFSLEGLLDWCKESNLCPICRTVINFEKITIYNKGKFNDFISQIKDKELLIIVNKLWHGIFKNSNIKLPIVEQSNFLKEKYITDKEKILNLSSISNQDIISNINRKYKRKFTFINIYEEIKN